MADYAGAATLAGSGSLSAYSRRVSGPVWQFSTPMLKSTYLGGAAAFGGKLYVIGGWGDANGNYVQAYDPTLNTWEQKADLPAQQAEGTAVAVGSYVYYVGGYNVLLGVYQPTNRRYDPATNTWTSLADVPGTGMQYATVGDSANAKLYVFSANASATAYHTYDIATDTWTSGTQPAAFQYLNGIMHSNGKAYLWSGTTFYEYNPATATFTAKAGGSYRIQPAMLSYDGLVWLAGGQGGTTYDPMNLSVVSYDPAANAWTSRDDLNQRRIGPMGDVIGGHMMIVGGWSLVPPSAGTPYWSSYVATSSEIYAPPLTSTGQLDMQLALYPAKFADAALTISLPFAADGRIDPQRLNPGFLKIGYRPPGYRDPVFMTRISGSEMPLPGTGDPDIYIGGGTDASGPTGLDEYGYVSSGQYLYVIAGYWDQYNIWDQWWSNRMYRFDAVTGTWTELAHLPGYVGSEGAKAGLIDGKIYALMGDAGKSPDGAPFCAVCTAPDAEFDEADTWMLQSLWIYDIAGDTWTRGPQPPFVDSYGAAAVLGGKLYYAQMYGPNWDESTGFAVFDPSTGVWTTLANQIFTPYDAPALWAGDGKLWMTNQDNVTGDVYIASYDVGTDAWTDETANFPVLPFFDAAAVVPLSGTVVRLMGGNDAASGSIAFDIDVVAKTLADAAFHWPTAVTASDNGYYGAFHYNGVTYAPGPRQGSVQNPVISMWRSP